MKDRVCNQECVFTFDGMTVFFSLCDDFFFGNHNISKQKLTYGKLASKFGELPDMGVNVLFTPGRESEVGVGVLQTPSRNQRLTEANDRDNLTAHCQDFYEGRSILDTPSRNQRVTDAEGVTETMTFTNNKQVEGVLPNSTPTERQELNLIPLSVLVNLLWDPTVVESTGGGGTSNDLDWNDERRRREEARENQYVHKPFKRRR